MLNVLHKAKHRLLLDEPDNGCALIAIKLNLKGRTVRQTILLPFRCFVYLIDIMVIS